jgi:hypothetical protein
MVEEPIAFHRALRSGEAARQAQEKPVPATCFDRSELNRILAIYGRMVAAGEWRDYALDFLEDAAIAINKKGPGIAAGPFQSLIAIV